MSAAVLRPPMSPLARRVRAYFAPVERATGAPAVFDPAAQAGFALDSPAAPWIDAGWIENFEYAPGTRIEPLRSGTSGAMSAQFRAKLEARLAFDFVEWGKLQMAIAAGCEHMNVLAVQTSAAPKPAGGDPVAAVPLQPGSTATELRLAAADLALFSVGGLLAVDIDYQQQAGYVGGGVAGAFVQDPADIGADVDFIRRVTFNVGRVAAKSPTSLSLAQPLLGGVPPAGALVQRVIAFVDREGGSFFQEWSGLFVIPEESGGRVCFYYPRLQPGAPAQEKTIAVSDWLHAWPLHASLVALPYDDPMDGRQVLRYRSYYPASAAALY